MHSVERGICPIAALNLLRFTLRFSTTDVGLQQQHQPQVKTFTFCGHV